LKQFMSDQRYLTIANAIGAQKYTEANELTNRLRKEIKAEHFGDPIYCYTLQMKCLCLYRLNRFSEAQIHLRNMAEFALVNKSTNAKLNALLNLIKHSLNYEVPLVLLN